MGAVDIVGPVTPPGHARGLGNAGVYTNRQKWPLGAVLGHLCTLLRLARVARVAVGTQECTQIGGSGLSASFWGICVHCCAVVDRCGDAGVYTDRQKWPLWAVLGHSCTLLRLARAVRVVPPLGWRLCRSSNPHKPPKEPPIETGQQVPGTHRRKVRSLSARRAPLVRREMRQAH